MIFLIKIPRIILVLFIPMVVSCTSLSVETKTNISQLSPEMQRLASILLSEKEIYDLNGGAIGLIPEPLLNMLLSNLSPELRRIYEITYAIFISC